MATTCFPHVELKNLGNHLAKLRAATTAFPAAPPSSVQWKTTPALQDTLTRLSLCGERVRDTATKFSLVLSSTTGGPGIKAISNEMRQSCDSLLAALAALVDPAVGGTAAARAGAGAGAPLMELYCQQTRAVLRATEDLIKHITSVSSNLLSSPTPRQSPLGVQTELAPKTGVVWEQCDKLGKLPRCNKVAFRRAFFNHYSAVKDTLREFEELLQEEAEEERTEGEEEEEEDDDLVEGVQDIELTGEEDEEGDFFGGERRMKEWERENVKRCLVALGHCGEMIKRVLDTVDEAMTEEGGEGGEGGREEGQEEGERIQKVAEVEESCQGLAAAVVNAADALYPPQIRQELELQLGALVAAAAHTAAAVGRFPAGSASRNCQEEMEKVRRAAARGVAEGTEGEEEDEEKGEDEEAGGQFMRQQRGKALLLCLLASSSTASSSSLSSSSSSLAFIPSFPFSSSYFSPWRFTTTMSSSSSSSSSINNSASPPPLPSSPQPTHRRKAKILCLHGYLQSASVFRGKIGSLRKGLKSKAEFIFVDAPFVAQVLPSDALLKAVGGQVCIGKEKEGGKEGAEELSTGVTGLKVTEKEENRKEEGEEKGERGRSWWHWTDTITDGSLQPRPSKALHYTGLHEKTLPFLRQALAEHEPDGLFAFSQGATAAALLLGALQKEFLREGGMGGGGKGGVVMPKFAILVGGFYPRDKEVGEGLREGGPTVPTLFVGGEADFLVPLERTRELMGCWAKEGGREGGGEDGRVKLHVHGGGHFVPTWKGLFKEEVVRFIEKYH
ncbi:hypothetical protein VYU27_002380 [Nannochloropsis oceanica]